MGYERRADGSWHKVAPERPEQMEEDDAPVPVDETAAGTSSAALADAPLDLLSMLADMRSHFDSRFNALNSRIDTLAEDVQALRTHVDDIATYQHQQFDEATERQDAMFDEIQTSHTHLEDLTGRFPPS